MYSALNHAASGQRPAVKSEPEHAKPDPSLIGELFNVCKNIAQFTQEVSNFNY